MLLLHGFRLASFYMYDVWFQVKAPELLRPDSQQMTLTEPDVKN